MIQLLLSRLLTESRLPRLPVWCSGSQPGVHGPPSGPQKISGGPQDSKFCITVNRSESTAKKG